MNREATVLVNSCDRYSDLWDPFARLWQRYWPDCPFEVVLLTESPVELKGAAQAVFSRVLPCGKMSWAKRLSSVRVEITTPYVLMLCEDYLLESRVDTGKMLAYLKMMKVFNAANLRLIPNPPGGSKYKDTELLEYRKNTAYSIATQAGFWEKEFLFDLAAKVESIWEFERYGSFALEGETRPLLHTRAKEFPFVDAVHKGYWEKFGKALVEREGIEFDFSHRGLPPFGVKLREGLKALVFSLVPTTPLVKFQNALGLGWKEQRRK